MNVGYASTMNHNDEEAICPICGSDVYGSKYGIDYVCINKECILNKLNAGELIRKIEKVIDNL